MLQQNETVVGSPINEDIAQVSTPSSLVLQSYKPHQTAGGQTNQLQNSNFRCSWPDCANTSGFRQRKDLKRHEKMHKKSPQWYCGCCRNLHTEFKGLNRKDKLLDHMRKRHQLPRSGSGIPPLNCPEEIGHNGQNLLFTTASCVVEHLRQEHSASMAPTTVMTTCG